MQTLDLNGPFGPIWRENTVGALYEIAKRAPGEPVTLLFGSEPVLLLQDMHHARHVLREAGASYRKNFGGFEGLFGESRFTSDGERWQFLQSLSQPHISAARPAQVVEAATASFAAAAARMLAERGANGGVVVDHAVDSAAARVISDVAFGNHGVDVEQALHDIREMLRFGTTRTWNLGGTGTPEQPEARANYDAARVRLAGAIDEALVRSRQGEQGSALVRDIDAGVANGAIPVDEISSLLFAGFDTTSAGIGWGLFLLATMPDLQAMLREKLRAALGGEAPSLERMEAVPELSAFVNEVLRIFPPVPILGRIAEADDEVGEVKIAREQRVVISIIGMHHDSRMFPAPAQVRLKRYEEGMGPGGQMAFGAGRRGCAGSRIANVEMATAFAVLIPRLEFNLMDQAPIQFDFAASIRRKGGHHLLVREPA